MRDALIGLAIGGLVMSCTRPHLAVCVPYSKGVAPVELPEVPDPMGDSPAGHRGNYFARLTPAPPPYVPDMEGYLEDAQEPSLLVEAYSQQRPAIRVVATGYRMPLIVRIVQTDDHHAHIVVKELERGYLFDRRGQTITRERFDELMASLERAGFWHSPSHTYKFCLDGGHILVEAAANGWHHAAQWDCTGARDPVVAVALDIIRMVGGCED